MKASEIVEQLEQGKKMKELEEELNLNSSTIRRRLKREGYVHDNGRWQFGECTEMSEKKGIKIVGKEEFTQEEIAFLKKFVKVQKDNELRDSIIGEFANEGNEPSLFERLQNIDEDENRERNSIFLSESVHNEFADFLKKAKLKNQKSMIVEIALMDFLEKHNKN
ncbi:MULTISPECIES: hypothetical protein [Bacillus]|uniref:hypothetical protein n=1 Tax=Bacillus TaxID=1386 RepID=UPI0003E20C01|nr:hypothetical protein [Bacillus cereus]ETT86132.1 hypothetical protein C175_03888 [Bacillus cereus]OOR37174.1 hypothetical protein BW895_28255 [Bacillus cereus]HDR6318937.1 hypothetical protein [Bacillus thuringiensis]